MLHISQVVLADVAQLQELIWRNITRRCSKLQKESDLLMCDLIENITLINKDKTIWMCACEVEPWGVVGFSLYFAVVMITYLHFLSILY